MNENPPRRQLSVTFFVEILALLSTGYLVTIACLFFGYFANIDLQFMSLFSVFDFTSQAVIVLPAALAALFVFTLWAQTLAGVAERLKIPFGTAVKGLAAGILAVMTLVTALGIKLIGDVFSVGQAAWAAVILAVVFGGALMFELRKEIAEQNWSSAASSAVLLAAAAGGALVIVGYLWCQFDVASEARFAVKPKDGGCFRATLIKSSETGVLVLNGDASRFEFLPFEAIEFVRAGACT